MRRAGYLVAAWIDGCSRLAVLMKVVLPLAKPALATVAVLTLLVVWNDLTWPLIAINSESRYTVQLGLATYQRQFYIEYGPISAGAVISIMPMLIGFALLRRHIMTGIATSGLRG
jgi:multiple sugar transport system permease protein